MKLEHYLNGLRQEKFVVSDELEIPAGLEGNIIFKLVGTNQAGRRVSAWGSLDGRNPLRESPSQR